MRVPSGAEEAGGHGGFIAAYLLATPAFVLADVAFDMPFRVAALEDSNHRFLYYGGAMLCGALSYARPSAAPWVGIGESATNLSPADALHPLADLEHAGCDLERGTAGGTVRPDVPDQCGGVGLCPPLRLLSIRGRRR